MRAGRYLGISDPGADVGIGATGGLFAVQQQNASQRSDNFSTGAVVLEASLVTHVLRFDLANLHTVRNAAFTSALNAAVHNDSGTAMLRVVQQFGGVYVIVVVVVVALCAVRVSP